MRLLGHSEQSNVWSSKGDNFNSVTAGKHHGGSIMTWGWPAAQSYAKSLLMDNKTSDKGKTCWESVLYTSHELNPVHQILGFFVY